MTELKAKAIIYEEPSIRPRERTPTRDCRKHLKPTPSNYSRLKTSRSRARRGITQNSFLMCYFGSGAYVGTVSTYSGPPHLCGGATTLEFARQIGGLQWFHEFAECRKRSVGRQLALLVRSSYVELPLFSALRRRMRSQNSRPRPNCRAVNATQTPQAAANSSRLAKSSRPMATS